MGMDLIGVGFTIRTDRKCDLDAIGRAIEALPDERLDDADFIDALDPSGAGMDFTPEELRDYLNQGAEEFDSASLGHRMSIAYPVQGTALLFIWTGGGSWGDDPFDGFTPLCYFINLCSMVDDVREAAGFVCGGLPGARLVMLYAGSGE